MGAGRATYLHKVLYSLDSDSAGTSTEWIGSGREGEQSQVDYYGSPYRGWLAGDG